MFYKLRFHSLDYYVDCMNEKVPVNLKTELEKGLTAVLQKAEQARYHQEIFYAVTQADFKDAEILLSYPALVIPGDVLVFALMDLFNDLAIKDWISRLVEPSEFTIEKHIMRRISGETQHSSVNPLQCCRRIRDQLWRSTLRA